MTNRRYAAKQKSQKMKKKIDLVEEEHESEHEESESSGDESEDEEPSMKDFWVIFPERCRKSVLPICCIVYGRFQRYSFLDSPRTITSK